MMVAYILPFYLAAASRIAGSRWKYLGLAMYPVPYCAIVYTAYNSWLVAALTFAWVFAFKLTGHADGFKGYVRDNTLSPVAVWVSSFFGIKRDSQAYDAIFWAIKGGLIAAMPAAIIAVFTASYGAAACIFCASFCGYPLAYWLGFNKLEGKFGKDGTAYAEGLAGFFSGLGFIGVTLDVV